MESFGSSNPLFQGVLLTGFTNFWPPLAGRPPVNVEITLLKIVNTSGAPATFDVCHDIDGAVFSSATALWWQEPIAAGESWEFQAQGPGTGISLGKLGELGARASVGSVLTLSAYGVTSRVGT